MVDGRTRPNGATILGEQLGVLRTDELTLLFCAFDAACSQMPDDGLDAERVAREIVAAFDRGVRCEWELANVVFRPLPARAVPELTPYNGRM